MKRTALAFLAMVCCGTASAGDLYTGSELALRAAAWKRVVDNGGQSGDAYDAGTFAGFVLGVRDAALDQKLLCMTEDRLKIDGHQQFATVAKFLENHPERWNEPSFLLTFEALRKLYPCAAKQ